MCGQAVPHTKGSRLNGPANQTCGFHLPEVLTQDFCRHAWHCPTQLAEPQRARLTQSSADHRFPLPFYHSDRCVEGASITFPVTGTSGRHDLRRVLQSAYLLSSSGLPMLWTLEGLWRQHDCFA
jgi:hypothetical protein